VTGLWNPRIAELTRFFAAAATTNCIAPALGSQRFSDYLAALRRTATMQA
jgi:hypothetical protein